MPPYTPLIQGYGQIKYREAHLGMKVMPYAELTMRGGPTYRIADGRYLGINVNHEEGEVYIEGFVLKNGTGDFWLSCVTSSTGQILRSREWSDRILMEHRNPFGKLFKWFSIFAFFFWVISIVNVVELSKKTME
jgi:hypothetical protein